MTAGHLRIRDFELIVALHEEGNMTQAANRLGITEPALSQQLKKIERRIQTHLFERGMGVSSPLAPGVPSSRVLWRLSRHFAGPFTKRTKPNTTSPIDCESASHRFILPI